jgi:hypothetical protein
MPPTTTTLFKQDFRTLISFIAAGAALLLAGCTTPPTKVTNPRPVVVRDFAFDVSRDHEDTGLLARRQGPVKRMAEAVHPSETPEEKAARLSALLSESIAKELTALNLPATRQPIGVALPANALLVQGQFLEMDEGNRLRRAIIGFGAGSSEVTVEVSVFDLAQNAEQPALTFGTGHHSKPMPGAIIFLNPYAMAARFVLSRNATGKDVRKLGKEIARNLAQIESGAPPQP